MTSTNLGAGFAHRHNSDGTVDSICYTCFMTVATEARELELMKAEQDHDCYDLARSKEYASPERLAPKGRSEVRADMGMVVRLG